MEVDFTPSRNPACEEEFLSYCGENGFYVRIDATNPANPLHNIRVIMPGFEGRQERFPFHPWFLQGLRRYSTLRFMDWQGTNHATVTHWANRTLLSDDSQAHRGGTGDAGMAVEYMVALANVLGANPWFCIPHTATDEYVREMARFVKASLRPDVAIYLEHSNEVWPQGHASGAYATERGLALGLSTDPNVARWRYNALRSKQIWSIWEEEFGRERLHYVLSTWAHNPTTTQVMLEYEDTADVADYVAVAGYFDCNGLGSTRATEARSMSVDAMFEECRESVDEVSSCYCYYCCLRLLTHPDASADHVPAAAAQRHCRCPWPGHWHL